MAGSTRGSWWKRITCAISLRAAWRRFQRCWNARTFSNSRRQIAGYTIGNDMSSRDMEGEILLYLPQVKVYDRSCAVGPFIRIGVDEAEVRKWTVNLQIVRDGLTFFPGKTTPANIKRS